MKRLYVRGSQRGAAHEHTPFCHVYGPHDLRRAFATMNADKLTPDALQALVRHKSYQPTQVYINMARQLDAAVASLHVPEVFKKGMKGWSRCSCRSEEHSGSLASRRHAS